jgi:energy-coupling factor transporter ATP-binding protein EcfA2
MPDGSTKPKAEAFKLTDSQDKAQSEIVDAYAPRTSHLLTGDAGSGKTYLLASVAKVMVEKKRSAVFTAPTHKAVAEQRKKLDALGLHYIETKTIQALLSLRPKAEGDRQVFKRDKRAEPVLEDIVVVDEASMPGADLMHAIRTYLPNSFVLFAGDGCQLPPVGEFRSQALATKSRSHLTTPVRQAADNPILTAAGALRDMQAEALGHLDRLVKEASKRANGRPLDEAKVMALLRYEMKMGWDWAKSAHDGKSGIFNARKNPEPWLKKAFTSDKFDADPDSFRVVAWTNQRVQDINNQIRYWRYGEEALKAPFMVGERALFRGPLVEKGNVLFSTNEEAKVLEIREGTFYFEVPRAGDADEWVAKVPSWQIEMAASNGNTHTIHMPQNNDDYQRVINQIASEAPLHGQRWQHMHDFKASMAKLEAIYAGTVHTSQGSTHETTFMDLNNIGGRVDSNMLEAMQLYYTAITRPSNALVVI